MDTLGLYLSIPFCRAKCTFCNFASGVFGEERMQGYVHRLGEEIRAARGAAERFGAYLPELVDTMYFGGGTPSLLQPEMVEEIFGRVRAEFQMSAEAEITVECAPGQLSERTLQAFLDVGMNRVSFGVQSFVDRESAAVGRLHTRAECLAELERMAVAGVKQRSLDLIAGLPHQTEASWRFSVDEAVATGVEHVSIYMLEVDEDSRLGRERLGQGGRYGADLVPDEDAVADWYEWAVARLSSAGVRQYEISNFAREGCESRHNVKYWTRQPYVGFGLDAHSMLRTAKGAVRWANPDEMESYVGQNGPLASIAAKPSVDWTAREQAFEESLFLGLRMNRGIDMDGLRREFEALADEITEPLNDLMQAGLVRRTGDRVHLTDAGRLASNEVFERLLVGTTAA